MAVGEDEGDCLPTMSSAKGVTAFPFQFPNDSLQLRVFKRKKASLSPEMSSNGEAVASPSLASDSSAAGMTRAASEHTQVVALTREKAAVRYKHPDVVNLQGRCAVRLWILRYAHVVGHLIPRYGYSWLVGVIFFDYASKCVAEFGIGTSSYGAFHGQMEWNALEYARWTILTSGLGWALAPGVRAALLGTGVFDDYSRQTLIAGSALAGACGCAVLAVLEDSVSTALGACGALVVWLLGAIIISKSKKEGNTFPPFVKSLLVPVCLSMLMVLCATLNWFTRSTCILPFLLHVLQWFMKVSTIDVFNELPIELLHRLSCTIVGAVCVPVALFHWADPEAKEPKEEKEEEYAFLPRLLRGVVAWRPPHLQQKVECVSSAVSRRRYLYCLVATVFTVASLWCNAFDANRTVIPYISVCGTIAFTYFNFWALPQPLARFAFLGFVNEVVGIFFGGLVELWYTADDAHHPQGPHISSFVSITTNSFIANFANLLGVFVFSFLFSGRSYRFTFSVTILLTMFCHFLDLALVLDWLPKHIGPVSSAAVVYVFVDGVLSEMMHTLNWMPYVSYGDELAGPLSDPLLGGLGGLYALFGVSVAGDITNFLLGTAGFVVDRSVTPFELGNVWKWIALGGIALPAMFLLPAVPYAIPGGLRVGDTLTYQEKDSVLMRPAALQASEEKEVESQTKKKN